MMWSVRVSSKQSLSDRSRDFIVELVSEEARSVIESYSFILHDVVESRRYSKLLIESTRISLSNLLSVIRNNLPYQVTCKRFVEF